MSLLEDVAPEHGGCWYCHKANGIMIICCEFDCNVHLKCVLSVAQHPSFPVDAEAQIIAREILGSEMGHVVPFAPNQEPV